MVVRPPEIKVFIHDILRRTLAFTLNYDPYIGKCTGDSKTSTAKDTGS